LELVHNYQVARKIDTPRKSGFEQLRLAHSPTWVELG